MNADWNGTTELYFAGLALGHLLLPLRPLLPLWSAGQEMFKLRIRHELRQVIFHHCHFAFYFKIHANRLVNNFPLSTGLMA